MGNRSRTSRVMRWVWRRKRLLIAIVLLAALGWGFHLAIRGLQARVDAIALLDEELSRLDFGRDPQRYLALQRKIDFERLEPAFYLLLLAIPLTFLLVLMGIIIFSSGREHRSGKSSEEVVIEMRERRAARELQDP